jgi:sugar/nucleoside kinase (ribokinase family)
MTDIVVKPEGALVVGSDRLATIRRLPGGSGANQAAWLAHFGVRTMFAGRVGRADLEERKRELAMCDVEPALAADDSVPTGAIVTLLAPDGERSFFTDRGANDRLCHADLPPRLLDGVDLVHVSGYSLFTPGPCAAVLDLFAEAGRRGIPWTIDPASSAFLEEVGAKNFLEWTRGAAICFPNAMEAATLTGAAQLERQLAILAAHYPLVVVKRGSEGATAAKGERRWSASAPVVRAIDTSGAGDAFLAAFLAAQLAGESMDACLGRAVAAGAMAVGRLGARPDSPARGPPPRGTGGHYALREAGPSQEKGG